MNHFMLTEGHFPKKNGIKINGGKFSTHLYLCIHVKRIAENLNLFILISFLRREENEVLLSHNHPHVCFLLFWQKNSTWFQLKDLSYKNPFLMFSFNTTYFNVLPLMHVCRQQAGLLNRVNSSRDGNYFVSIKSFPKILVRN